MADEIKDQFGMDTKLIKGRGGVFEVQLGERLIFSKKQLGRFPEDGEIGRLLSET